jgi:hypothetical protein
MHPSKLCAILIDCRRYATLEFVPLHTNIHTDIALPEAITTLLLRNSFKGLQSPDHL